MLQTNRSDHSQSPAVAYPRAYRMVLIAFLNQNIGFACMWGGFSVLLTHVETRLGISRTLSTLAPPAVSLATAIFAPITGNVATRYSLKLLMMLGSLLSVAGYLLLAFSANYPSYLLAYGLLIGPGLAVVIVVAPTLVTRWFPSNAGRALGIVSIPIIMAVVPILVNMMVQAHGMAASYILLAGLTAISVISNFFIIDHPPQAVAGAQAAGHGAHAPSGADAKTMPQLLASPRLWAYAFAYIAGSNGLIILLAHMVPLARTWGLSATSGAELCAIFPIPGVVGTLLFGWLADRLGATPAIAILMLSLGVLFGVLLFQPSFASAALIVGSLGLVGAGLLPVVNLALDTAFGQPSFSRAWGLVNLINLPFAVLSVPAAAIIYTRTGSYYGVLASIGIALLIASLTVLAAQRRRAPVLAG